MTSKTIAMLARLTAGAPRGLPVALFLTLVLAVLLVAVVLLPGSTGTPPVAAAPTPPNSSSPAPTASPTPKPTPTPTVRPSPTETPAVTPSPAITPVPTPTPIYEDLSGVATTEALAHRYPIAVMLDDAPAARPQSGLSEASVVWHAPVEGGIPRYMAIFQSGDPGAIGPVRSARLYFVRWAAEWKALYLHAGGPPPLRNFLNGSQKLVVNADGKRTARVGYRGSPHNLYSDGGRLRRYGEEIGAGDDDLAYDPTKAGVLQPFRDAAALDDRGPDGGTISVTYRSERVGYTYHRESNTWLRIVDGKAHRDAQGKAVGGNGASVDGPRIAPTSVVVMRVAIRRAARVNGPAMGALEADSIGTGSAWVFADGRVTKATWSKANERSRTRFLDASGKEIVLPRGQIFVQVVSDTSSFSHKVEAAG